MDNILSLIDRTFPLPGRYRRTLPQDVVELSRLLTSNRGGRTGSYLGKPALLSAYLRYFLPWNLYRLCHLLPALPLALENGDAISDLGSGPLTFTLALWLSRPDLRDTSLEFRCLDQTGAVLDAGTRLFQGLAGSHSPWKIRTIRASLGEAIHGSPVRLVSALNLFNELYGKIPETDSAALSAFAEKNARLLSGLAAPSGSILVMDPGVPRSGEFITILRSHLVTLGRLPLAPCPHTGPCPLGNHHRGGGKAKWCHFALDTTAAPPELHRLSEAAGLPKERVTFSFLLTGQADQSPVKAAEVPVRIISDPFPIDMENAKGPGRFGRYGCSEKGLVLVSGERHTLEGRESGALVPIRFGPQERRDFKSGALIGEIK